jgi:polyhydroxyalkanoate depolymerase
MAGPVDIRINPNRVNEMAATRPMSFFERRLIDTVPRPYAGGGRRVYPGVTQLTAFMSMNPKRHMSAHVQLYRDLVAGNTTRAAATQAFYDEYGAVMDVPAEFYLDTIRRIFKDNHMATGQYTWRDQPVDPAVISRTALLTVEGAQDDICSPGQTQAAHDLCTGIPAERKRHHLQNGVGHYGVFSGSRWETEVYPVVRSFIADSAAGVLPATGLTPRNLRLDLGREGRRRSATRAGRAAAATSAADGLGSGGAS